VRPRLRDFGRAGRAKHAGPSRRVRAGRGQPRAASRRVRARPARGRNEFLMLPHQPARNLRGFCYKEGVLDRTIMIRASAIVFFYRLVSTKTSVGTAHTGCERIW
jgi:hypothetical protein